MKLRRRGKMLLHCIRFKEDDLFIERRKGTAKNTISREQTRHLLLRQLAKNKYILHIFKPLMLEQFGC